MSRSAPAWIWRWLCALVVALLLLASGAARAYPVPALSGPVVDEAGVLDAAAKAQLADKLRRYKAEAGPQIQVYVARSLQGESIEDVSYQVARTWNLGDAERDDGVLLLVAASERRIRIETGQGVGDRITDLQAAAVIREQIAPALKRGDYAAGLNAGVDQLAHLLGAESAPAPRAIMQDERAVSSPVAVVVGVVLMLIFLAVFSGRGGGGGGGGALLAGMWLGAASRGGWSSGGGSWGGGGGGWSGGGGGFGGGGASGDY